MVIVLHPSFLKGRSYDGRCLKIVYIISVKNKLIYSIDINLMSTLTTTTTVIVCIFKKSRSHFQNVFRHAISDLTLWNNGGLDPEPTPEKNMNLIVSGFRSDV